MIVYTEGGIELPVFGTADEATLKQMFNVLRAEEGAQGALMADNHKGYNMPIGGVVAYRDHISPSCVGFDIGCGNMAVNTGLRAGDLDYIQMADRIWHEISFGIGRTADIATAEQLDRVRDLITNEGTPPQKALLQKALAQLGTVGSGNHYVDVFEDCEDYVWVGVHFGSRGFGHTTEGIQPQGSGRLWNEAQDK